jgi:hypothetical protein
MNRIHHNGSARGGLRLGHVVTAGFLVAGVCLATPALAAARHPDGSWGGQHSVPKASSSLAPAACTTGTSLFVAYTTAKGGIDYATHTTKWSSTESVSAKGVTPSTTSAPAIAVFDGHLYVFWINKSGQIRYTDKVKGKWQPTRTVSGSWGTAESSTSPAVTVIPGSLYVAWKGHSTDDIWYSSTTGSSWATQQVAVKDATSFSPAIAPTGVSAAPLVFAWTTSADAIDYGILGFLGFEPIGAVPQAGTNAAPSLDFMSAAPGETMYLAWKGTHTDDVFFDEVTNFSGSSFGTGSWTGQATIPSASTSTGPVIAGIGTTLYAVYKARSSDSIEYQSATTPSS